LHGLCICNGSAMSFLSHLHPKPLV
jgi:hypothetical protein